MPHMGHFDIRKTFFFVGVPGFEPGVASLCATEVPPHFRLNTLSGCRDSNPESPVPKTGMLAVTPHPDNIFNPKTGLRAPWEVLPSFGVSRYTTPRYRTVL